jgi:hypothetical protein
MKELATGAQANGYEFICVGDKKSPEAYDLTGCRFVSLKEQIESDFELAKLCPENHYTRKNIGYLMAIQSGAHLIIETDDDNVPLLSFWAEQSMQLEGRLIEDAGWINAYSYFTDKVIWPRGFPLEYLKLAEGKKHTKIKQSDCMIQQGLADGDPDVDAVYRLTRTLPFTFNIEKPIILKTGCWSPFNSQNTIWFKDVYTLLYLPSYCNFRMTDIWRSFVAQACMWPNGWHIAFLSPTVYQERNQHNLLKDFEDELPGYLNNDRIVKRLMKLQLKSGKEYLFINMKKCYSLLIEMELIDSEELKLLDAWQKDLSKIGITF